MRLSFDYEGLFTTSLLSLTRHCYNNWINNIVCRCQKNHVEWRAYKSPRHKLNKRENILLVIEYWIRWMSFPVIPARSRGFILQSKYTTDICRSSAIRFIAPCSVWSCDVDLVFFFLVPLNWTIFICSLQIKWKAQNLRLNEEIKLNILNCPKVD